MRLNRRRAWLMLAALIGTFVFFRVYLTLSPNTNLDIGPYNIHHLYVGLLLVVAAGIPLALFQGNGRALDVVAAAFGVGLSMALDEWVYLIATDGSDAAYLSPVSLWGGAVMIGLACLYILGLVWVARKSRSG
jgi:hypothetical protein